MADATVDPPRPPAGAPNGRADAPESALVTRNDGTHLDPSSPEEWAEWVSASRTRNYLRGDPLLDWLDRFGDSHGYERDDAGTAFDPRSDFLTFIFAQGQAFEAGVLRLIAEQIQVVRIETDEDRARSLSSARATARAMQEGAPAITQAVLRNPDSRTYGVADLLVRSDVLNKLVPGTLDEQEARIPAPSLGGGPWHYRVIDIKYSTLDLEHDGALDGASALAYRAQVWIYNEALGRLQGYRPPASYILGRGWKAGARRGTSCFDRLGRVNHDAFADFRADRSLADATNDAIAWLRRLAVEGAAWSVLPEPSVPELYPNARGKGGSPWSGANARIAAELAELTMLPGMTPVRRQAAHARGIRRWDQAGVSAAALDVPQKQAAQFDAVLAVNMPGAPVVLPNVISNLPPDWRTPADLEFYVDFETITTIGDDFSRLPEKAGQSLIFQIGCGWWEAGAWRFDQWTVDRLTETEESVVIANWIEHMDALRRARGLTWNDARIIHWWKAETASLDTAYNSARARHGHPDWPMLPWFDFLTDVVRAAPVTVRGAFGFGLKAIAKAMYAHGLIETVWAEGPADGMGALVGALWCDGEASRTGVPMPEIPLMTDIGRYNEVDCRSMAEIVAWLRVNR